MIQRGKILYPELSYDIVGAAMEVHRVLGPGYLEKVYEGALARELHLREIPFKQQQHIPVFYKEIEVGYYIADLLVDGKIVLELKSASAITGRHEAQAINYLTTTGYELAIIINFGRTSLETKRVLNKFVL